MKGRFRKVFDTSGLALSLLILVVFVWLSSDGQISFSRDSGYYDEAFTLKSDMIRYGTL